MSGSAPLEGATQRGFTYLGILFALAFIAVGLSATGQIWSVTARRSDEEQLLFVGDSFRRAFASYYRTRGQYPRSLEELVRDERSTPPVRHLRKIYADPITRQADWRLVTRGDGTIVGVASQSTGKPLKVANFPQEDRQFEGAACYCDWEFIYLPPLRRGFRMAPRGN